MNQLVILLGDVNIAAAKICGMIIWRMGVTVVKPYWVLTKGTKP